MERDFTLEASIRACRSCPLGDKRVARMGLAVPAHPGVGYDIGGLAFVAEAPGRDEDMTGLPLVGRAGKLFSALLEAARISRDEVLLLNRVCCRPPDNNLRDVPEAVPACSQWFHAAMDIYKPRIAVLMGATAIGPLFGHTSLVERTRGTARTKDGVTYVATYHPAAVLRRPSEEFFNLVAGDFRLAAELLAASREVAA